ncbi:MAG: hypothetical protein LBN71_08850 [Tannerella sp.]|jgi:hypothetical protein|nr:hypothetical protein [Tannerella sp.]
MLEFLSVPVIVYICVWGVYSLFELFARRSERMAIIEKFGANLDSSALNGKLVLPNYSGKSVSFSGLKLGCLLTGLGLGLLIGLMITTELLSDGYDPNHWPHRELFSVAFGASALFFGGAGLLVSFIIESKLKRKEKKEEND